MPIPIDEKTMLRAPAYSVRDVPGGTAFPRIARHYEAVGGGLAEEEEEVQPPVE
mgnify:CR=1 FL=1